MTTNTPRTDAAEIESVTAYKNEMEAGWPPWPSDGYDFARQLESELAELRELQGERLKVAFVQGAKCALSFLEFPCGERSAKQLNKCAAELLAAGTLGLEGKQ